MLTRTLNEIWGIERSRPVCRQRGLAIMLVLAFVVPTLLLASFAGSMIATLRTLLPDHIIQVVGGITLGVVILLDVALFMVLYLMLPYGDSTWREILPGAIGAGLLWELAKKAFLFFIATYISASNLGLPERAYLSLWRLRERLLLPAKTAASRSAKRKSWHQKSKENLRKRIAVV